MGSEIPRRQRSEELDEALKEMGLEGLVADTRTQLLKAQIEGRKPWEVGRSDVEELLTAYTG